MAKARVLIVDDEPKIGEMLARALESDEVYATYCQDPEWGLRILKEEPVAPPTSATEGATSEEQESPERIVIANYPNHVWGTPDVPGWFRIGADRGTMLIMFAA